MLLASTCPWTSTPKLAIALAGAGCAVAALIPARHPLGLTLAVARRFRYRATRPLRSLADAIAEVRPDLIIACDERAVEHLHRLHARTDDTGLRALIERSLGRPENYGRATSRRALIELASRLGLAVPDTATVRSRTDLRAWARSHPLPWALKTDGSWGGMGVRIVHSLVEAEQAFEDLSRPFRPLRALQRRLLRRDPFWLAPWLHHPRAEVTVQAFVEGRPANCAIAAWAGEALAGLAVDVLASDGETGPAAIVRRTEDPQMLEAGAELVQALGLSGLVGFDFIVEARSGRAFLLELNPRATPIAHLRLGSGRDLVGALTGRLVQQTARDWPAETAREVIALFPQAAVRFEGHPMLASAYHDAPRDDPVLVRALLRKTSRRRPQFIVTVAPAE